jgi:hypothetical protein
MGAAAVPPASADPLAMTSPRPENHGADYSRQILRRDRVVPYIRSDDLGGKFLHVVLPFASLQPVGDALLGRDRRTPGRRDRGVTLYAGLTVVTSLSNSQWNRLRKCRGSLFDQRCPQLAP